MAREIDLNSDLGESFGPWRMGDDEAMLSIVTSANVAAGGHASDPETMYRTLLTTAERGVVVGAHPGYTDREGFGRRVIPMRPGEVARMIAAQIGALQAIAALAGTEVVYVKPHGALANLAADDEAVAQAIAETVEALPGKLAILAISGTALDGIARRRGMRVASEIFADRNYLPSGRLVPRSRSDALLHDADAAAARLVRVLETGLMPVIGGDPIPLKAESICVHGDGAAAVAMARALRLRLEEAGVTLRPCFS